MFVRWYYLVSYIFVQSVIRTSWFLRWLRMWITISTIFVMDYEYTELFSILQPREGP